MTNFICINGYDQPDNCEHCGKRLIHGVRTNTHGTIGADCFVKLIKADKKRFSGNGKPTASMIRDFAKMVERRYAQRLSEMGYSPATSSLNCRRPHDEKAGDILGIRSATNP